MGQRTFRGSRSIPLLRMMVPALALLALALLALALALISRILTIVSVSNGTHYTSISRSHFTR